MKKIIIPVAVLVLLISACKSEKKAETIVETTPEVEAIQPVLLEGSSHLADVSTSLLTWKGSKPTGTHNGTLKLKEGAVIADSTGLKQGVFVIDINSLTNLDLPADSEDNAKLVGHLLSPDFFDVANNPIATFTFSEVETKGTLSTLKGELTIKGIKKPFSIPVTVSESEGVTTLKAAPFKVDRTEFDIRYGSKKFFDNLKDKFINDIFEIGFEVNLKSTL